jgi:hypothetical protein
MLGQLARLGTPCSLPGCLVGSTRPVADTAAIAPDFAADRRYRSTQLVADLV